ncbi:hypothetical protein BGX23_009721 [Mortierella sp. AD031]|nr:hypothetical protein BGX23_009721 [Mortierella sp. AD031]
MCEVPYRLTMEIRSKQGVPSGYGSIELHHFEILKNSQAFYKDDLMYREHRSFISSVDLYRAGCLYLDTELDGPQTVTDYAISEQGSHVLVSTIAGNHRFLQLWNIKDPPVTPRRSSQKSDRSHQSDAKESPRKPFLPQLTVSQVPKTRPMAFQTIYNTATPLQVREYKNETRRILERKPPLDPMVFADVQSQVAAAAGDGGGGIRNGQLDSVGTYFGDEALMTLFVEQLRAYEELRVAHEEQR